MRGADGRLKVGSSRPKVDPAAGPSWASAAAAPDDSLPSGRLDAFKLLYAGTADKTMMLELEADQVGGLDEAVLPPSPSLPPPRASRWGLVVM